MKIPADATSFCPPVLPLQAGDYRGHKLRHTFRPSGTGDWLIIFTLAGSGLYRGAHGEFRSSAGDVTLYRPGVFQDYQIAPDVGRWALLWAHFLPRTEWVSWLAWPEIVEGLMHLKLQDATLRRRVVLRLREMIRWETVSRAQGKVLGQNALEEVLIWCDSVNPRRTESSLDPRVGKAMDFLTTHSSAPFSEIDLTRAAGLSASRLRNLFKAETGSSPRRFQELQRLRKARDLLSQSRHTIAQIAIELGFNNPFYFTLRFKKETGENPRAYRLRTTGTEPRHRGSR